MVAPIQVGHAGGSYPVYVESGALLSLPVRILEAVGPRPLVLITDENVLDYYDEWTSGTREARRLGARASDAGVRIHPVLRLTFPPGEQSKSRETWARLTDQMLATGIGRDAVVVAMGGGVTGDLGGFVAATYMRGLPCVQVPTTLLAMVDASVGGKVGVDTPAGKNLVGAFHAPALVVSDPLTLVSLPERDYRGGLVEAVKHGLIADAGYFEWIEENIRPLKQRQPGVLEALIRRSVEIKAEVVGADETEQGRRAILNAGHTIGHALESESNYTIPHGEAVAMGLLLECSIAERRGIAEPGTRERLGTLLRRVGVPVQPPAQSGAALARAMQSDKKSGRGEIRCALPAAIGRMHEEAGQWTTAVSGEDFERVLGGREWGVGSRE